MKYRIEYRKVPTGRKTFRIDEIAIPITNESVRTLSSHLPMCSSKKWRET